MKKVNNMGIVGKVFNCRIQLFENVCHKRSLEVTRGHLAGVPQEAAGPGPAVPLAPGTQQPRVLRAGDEVWVAGHRGHGDVVTLSRVLQHSTVQHSTVQYMVRCYLAPHSPGLSTATLVDCSRVEVGPPGSISTSSLRITYY